MPSIAIGRSPLTAAGLEQWCALARWLLIEPIKDTSNAEDLAARIPGLVRRRTKSDTDPARRDRLALVEHESGYAIVSSVGDDFPSLVLPIRQPTWMLLYMSKTSEGIASIM